MRIWPASEKKRFRIWLIPFQVYVLAAPFWLTVWKIFIRNFDGQLLIPYESQYLASWYVPCFLIFLVAMTVQLLLRWWREAAVSAGWVVITFFIFVFYLAPMGVK